MTHLRGPLGALVLDSLLRDRSCSGYYCALLSKHPPHPNSLATVVWMWYRKCWGAPFPQSREALSCWGACPKETQLLALWGRPWDSCGWNPVKDRQHCYPLAVLLILCPAVCPCSHRLHDCFLHCAANSRLPGGRWDKPIGFSNGTMQTLNTMGWGRPEMMSGYVSSSLLWQWHTQWQSLELKWFSSVWAVFCTFVAHFLRCWWNSTGSGSNSSIWENKKEGNSLVQRSWLFPQLMTALLERRGCGCSCSIVSLHSLAVGNRQL